MSEPKLRGKGTRWRLLAVLLAFVSVSLWGLLQAEPVREHARRELAEAVRAELGLDATLGSLEFRLPFRLAARSIRFDHPAHGLLVSARELLVVPSFWGLLQGELKLKRLIIEGARVRLLVRDGAVVNLPDLRARARPDDAQETLNIPLDELLIHHASLQVDGGERFMADLSAVNIVARIAEGTRVNFQLSTGRGQLAHEKGREELALLLIVARYRPGHLDLDRARLESSLAKLSVSRASLDLPLDTGRYRGTAQVELDLARIYALPHGLDLPVLGGKVAVSASGDGTGKRFRVKGSLHGENPILTDSGFGLLDLRFDANEREIRLLPGSQGRIIEDGGLVLLEGRLGLSDALPVEVRAEVKHLVFQKLMAQLGTTQDCVVDWHLRGGFRLKGTINPVAITGPIWAEHLSFRALTGAYHDPASREVIGTPPGRVSGRVNIRPDALRFENLLGKLPHSEMLVTVHVGFDDKIGVTARSQKLDLRDATGLMQKPLAGHGGFSLDVGGTYEDTTLTGTLDLEDFVFWGDPLGHIKTRAVMEKDGSAVRFVDTDVRKNSSHYIIDDLFLDFTEELRLEAHAHFEQLALSDFYDSVGVAGDPDFAPYDGIVHGSASARYTLGFRGDGPDGTLLVDASLDVPRLSAYGLEFQDGRAEASWHWRDIAAGIRGAQLELRELQLRKGRGGLVARGTMRQGGKLRLTVVAEALRMHDLSVLREQGIAIEGELSAAGTLDGTLSLPEVALDVELVGMQVAGRALGDGHARVLVTHRNAPWVQGALALDPAVLQREPCPLARSALARASWPGLPAPDLARVPSQAVLVCGPVLRDRVLSDLALGLDPQTSVRGRLELRGLPTAWFLSERAAKLAALVGDVSGALAFSGGMLGAPDSLVGSIELSRLALGKPSVWLANDGPLRVALTGRGARIERARLVGQGTQVALYGGATLAEGLATSVQGALDLSVLPSFVPQILSASGILEGDVKLTGALDDPALFGRAELTQASLLTSYYPHPFEALDARLSFSDRELLLEALSARFSGGEIRMHGSAAVKDRALARYELALAARDVNVEPEQGLELTLAAETVLTGGEGGRLPLVQGTVRLARARYVRPFSLGIAERLTGFSQAKRAVREAYDPERDRLALDLRIVQEGPIRINNNLLSAELSIEDSERPFRLVGTDQRVGMLGVLAFERGTVRFRSSEFRVEEGTVRFIDEHRIRPQIDVHARTEFRRTADVSGAHWSILLHATGEVDDLKLETSSEPALASEDIALLLTAGLTRAEAERIETSSLTQGAALEALATVAGVDREVKRALPVIDDFAVTSAYSVRTNRTEPQLVIGKRLSEKVRASATTGLTTDSYFKTNVEWRLNDQTSVAAGYDNVQTTTASQFGNVGVDLRWRLEFD